MGQRGPAPKPTQLKALHGTYRPDRANGAEVFPDGPEDMCPPEWISEPRGRSLSTASGPLRKTCFCVP